MYPITTRDEPARKIAALRHIGPYHRIGESFEKFSAICSTRNLWPQVGPVLGIYCDNPEEVPEDKLVSFAGAEWRGSDLPEGMEALKIAGGKTAVLTYKGPYSGLVSAYDTLFGDWLPKSGEEPADAPCYEISLNNPRETAPEDLLTEICLPLK